MCVCHNRCLEFITLPRRYVTPLAEDTVLAATGLQHVKVQDPGVKRNMLTTNKIDVESSYIECTFY